MSVDREKLTRLRIAAEACGNERWEAHEDASGKVRVTLAGDGAVVVCEPPPGAPPRARHIAEADPATVLALLDRIEELERMAGNVDGYADALGRRCAALRAVVGHVAEFEADLKELSRAALKWTGRR